jgi:hypothetical protein
MILRPLIFKWDVREDENHVHFSVSEQKAYAIHMKYYSRGKIPPIHERVEYLKNLGLYTGAQIKKVVKDHIQWQKNSEKNQAVIDNIFLKFNVKPIKKKALKSVKK